MPPYFGGMGICLLGGLVQAGEQALQTDGLLQGAVLHRAAFHQIQKRRGLPRKAEPGRLGEVLRTRLPPSGRRDRPGLWASK